MSQRERLKTKIAALLAKTRAAGCTEAEAMAAAEMAAKLMTEHGLDPADIEMTEASSPQKTVSATWRNRLSAGIASCTNTASIVLVDHVNGTNVLFVGREPGPQIAVYLRDICIRAVERELVAFKAGTFYRRRRSTKTRRAAAADFVDGMVLRLRIRLYELFKPARNDNARLEAERALAVMFAGAVSAMPKTRKGRYSDATTAGWQAGADVSLNRGVDGGSGTRLIGSAS